MINRLKFLNGTNLLKIRNFSSLTINAPREIKIKTPGGTVAAKVWNEYGKKTPIIAFHGWMDNAGSFDNLCPHLDKDFPVYAVDFPGHGFSYHPSVGNGVYFTDFLVFAHRIINYLHFKKVILLGHSLGGNVALCYTGTIPEVVEKLITIDAVGPFCIEAAYQPEITAISLKELIKVENRNPNDLPRYSYDEIIQRLIKGHVDTISEDAAKILLVRNSRKHEDGKYSFTFSQLLKVKSTLGITPEQAESFISGVDCDFLLVKSPTSPRFGGSVRIKDYLSCYKKTSKNFILEMVEGSHFLHIMKPIPVAEAINNFLHDKEQTPESRYKAERFLKSLK